MHEDDSGSRSHRWEWFDGRWPDEDFYMAPDALEPAPTASLSGHFALPAAIHPVAGAGFRAASAGRIYEVTRVDGRHRPLATLAVERDALHWLEIDHGAPLELMPGWLWFRRRLEVRGAFSRRLCQARLRGSRRRCTGAPAGATPVTVDDVDLMRPYARPWASSGAP